MSLGSSSDPDLTNPAAVRFEAARLRWLLREFGLWGFASRIASAEEFRSGERRLTFAGFRMEFPTFPIVLEGRYESHMAFRCRPRLLFRKFAQTVICQDFIESFGLLAAEANGRPLGIAMPLDNLSGGVIIHNGRFGTRGSRMTYDVAGDHAPHRVTVEMFFGLMRYIARGGWTPSTPLPESCPTEGPRVARGLVFEPWMVRRVGPGPPLVVLAWLRHVLQSTSAYDRAFVRRADGGGCFVAATHDQMAAMTGLSARQVKRALAVLRKECLIDSVRGDGTGHIRLVGDAFLGPGAAGRDQLL